MSKKNVYINQMRVKRLVLMVIAVTMALLMMIGCSKKSSKDEKRTDEPTVSDEGKEYKDITFSQMPKMNQDYVSIKMSSYNAYMQFIEAKEDDTEITVASYSLEKDCLLGTKKMEKGVNDIYPLSDGNFYALNSENKQIILYNEACTEIKRIQIDGVLEVGYTKSNNDGTIWLILDEEDQSVKLCNISSGTWKKLKLDAASYDVLGYVNNRFYIRTNDGVDSIDNVGNIEHIVDCSYADKLLSKYIVGVGGEYITFSPIDGGKAIMTKTKDGSELLQDARGNVVLSTIAKQEGGSVLRIYQVDKMTVSEIDSNDSIISAAVLEDGRVYVIGATSRNEYTYRIYDAKSGETKPLVTEEYDEDKMEGYIALPEITGDSACARKIKDILDKYGVRIMYGEDVFDFEGINCTVEPASEEEVYEKVVLLPTILDMLPAGLWREVGGKRPMVIYLCKGVQPSAGGVNTVYQGYNITILSIMGKDDYFKGIALHEFGHALERNVDKELLDGWINMMPEGARKACTGEGASLTVEYTVDDKGRTPVWYTDAYGRSDPMEDRATVFMAMNSTEEENDNRKLFSHEGLCKKAEYWEKMIRETYSSCKDATFDWVYKR